MDDQVSTGLRACDQGSRALGAPSGDVVGSERCSGEKRIELALRSIEHRRLDEAVDDRGAVLAKHRGDFLGSNGCGQMAYLHGASSVGVRPERDVAALSKLFPPLANQPAEGEAQ